MKPKKKKLESATNAAEPSTLKKPKKAKSARTVEAKATGEFVSQKDFNNLANIVNQFGLVLDNMSPQLDTITDFIKKGEESQKPAVVQNPVPSAESPTPTQRLPRMPAPQDVDAGLGKYITPELISNFAKIAGDFLKTPEQPKTDPIFGDMQSTFMNMFKDGFRDYMGKINTDRQISEWVLAEIKKGEYKVGAEGIGKQASS